MNRGHLGGVAFICSHKHLSWLTLEGPERMRYRIKEYPWRGRVRTSTAGHRAEVKDESEKEEGAQASFGQGQDVRVGKVLAEGHHSTGTSHLAGTDFLVEKDQEYCVCEMPCNLTRYGKELSMVKIPSKASAKYLAKKFNKSEQYIG